MKLFPKQIATIERILSNTLNSPIKVFSNGLFEITNIEPACVDSYYNILKRCIQIKLLNKSFENNNWIIRGLLADDVDLLQENVEIHKTLNSKIWAKDKTLLPEVKTKIIQIVDSFKHSIEQDGIALKIEDIYILGSNANYNYTLGSDLDIHIIADESFDCNENHLQIIYNAYKTLFNKKYDITIKGISVELYVENKDKITNVSTGIYSVFSDKWLKEPSKIQLPEVDELKISNEVSEWEQEFLEIVENPDIISIENFIDDLYNRRTSSIIKEGEFGIGNLVFKEIRNLGYIEELKNLRDKLKSEELSLKG